MVKNGEFLALHASPLTGLSWRGADGNVRNEEDDKCRPRDDVFLRQDAPPDYSDGL